MNHKQQEYQKIRRAALLLFHNLCQPEHQHHHNIQKKKTYQQNLYHKIMLSSSNSWTRFLHPMIDIVLHVEGKTFPANKSVLSQHSGYFRTVLSPNTTSLILPTVPAEYFALLLVKSRIDCGVFIFERTH